MRKTENKKAYLLGLRHGVPIGFGYFAVAFSLGITAGLAGLNAMQGFITSLMINASAGEYAGFKTIAEKGSYFEMTIITIVANARYLLMSCALSQRISKDTKFVHRFGLGFCLTDEVFGITVAQHGYINPWYSYGAMTVASPCWATGTMLGIIVGNLLPVALVNALSASLYGMFLAIIIPPSRKDGKIRITVIVSFVMSFLISEIKIFSKITAGTKIIILTIILSSLFAIIFPVKDENEEKKATDEIKLKDGGAE